MLRHLLPLLFFGSAAAGWAQLESDTLTITSTRELNIQPDKAQVMVNVTAPGTMTLDAVISTLEGTGITAANLVGARAAPIIIQANFPPSQPVRGDVLPVTTNTMWTFVLTSQLSNLGGTLGPLARLQPQRNMDLSYYVQEAPAATPSCPWTALLADAQAQAQIVANAAGLKLGPMVSLSDQNERGVVVQRIGVFSSFSMVIGVLSYSSAISRPTTAACSLTVQFKLLR